MQIDLADKPKVIALANLLSLDVDTVVGKLHRLWGWADRQTTDGNALGVTPAFIDSRLGVIGFADALVAIGWLEVSPLGIQLVRFEEHNGKTAKTRALTSVRVANHKQKGNAKTNGDSVTDALPREEKRREENKESPLRGRLPSFFDVGIGIFMAAGDTEAKARAFLGKLAKGRPKEEMAIAVAKLSIAGDIADPKAYLQGILKPGNGKATVPYAPDDSFDKKYGQLFKERESNA